jgi:hypothetical protein
VARKLDWQKHDKELTTFIKKVTNFYLRTSASTGELLPPDKGILLRNNYATPVNMQLLLTYLARLTDQIDDELQGIRTACLQANMDLNECVAGSTTFGPIFSDLQSWKERLGEYQRLTNEAEERDPNASGDEDEEFWDHVTKPLLLGLFPGADRQRRLDSVTPIIIAWQIEVAEQAYVDAREQFWQDLKARAKEVAEHAASFGGGLIFFAVGALALGYGLTR